MVYFYRAIFHFFNGNLGLFKIIKQYNGVLSLLRISSFYELYPWVFYLTLFLSLLPFTPDQLAK